jgi:diphthine synthase
VRSVHPVYLLQEQLYGKKVIVADRELVESKCDDEILEKAKTKKVALLVVGDPFGFVDSSVSVYMYRATTHADIMVRARKMGIEVSSIHNASIMNAVGICGLQLYRYGQTVSLCFWTENWKPDSYYDKIKENRALGLHTLCLLGKVDYGQLIHFCRY